MAASTMKGLPPASRSFSSLHSLQKRPLCVLLARGVGAPLRGPPLKLSFGGSPVHRSIFSPQQRPSISRSDGGPNLEGPLNSVGAPEGPPLKQGGPWWGPYASLVRLHAPVASAGSATAAAAKAAAALPSTAALLAAAAYTAVKSSEADEQKHQQKESEEALRACRAGVGQQEHQPQEQQQQGQQQQRSESESQQQQTAKAEWLPQVWTRAACYLCLCGVGALLMRSAGCIVNDIWDRSIDNRVERTKGRPLACGALGLRGALGALGALLLPSLWVLLQFNTYTVSLGLSSLLLVAVYPAMKRLIALPQLFLGLTFSWGALLGWAALLGPLGMPPLLAGKGFLSSSEAAAPRAAAAAAAEAAAGGPQASDPSSSTDTREVSKLNRFVEAPSRWGSPTWWGAPSGWGALAVPTEWAPVCLYLGCVLWTLTYDTLYAFQDVKDDKKIGVKSSALTWGPRGARFWGSVSLLGQASLWTLAGAPLEAPGPYLVGVAACCAWLGKLLWCTDLQQREACAKAFKANHQIGALFAASIVASKALEWARNRGAPDP
ncbi:hypothetical protein Efla_002416 [Eimeria flavescens]